MTLNPEANSGAPPQELSPLASIAQKAATAGAAALLTLGSLSGGAIASEFDIAAEPVPTTHYYVDDANVLSRATRGEVDKKLKILEVDGAQQHATRLACLHAKA